LTLTTARSSTDDHPCVSTSKRKQRTLAKPVSISGIGLFTGLKMTMRLLPEEENSGICFRRVDIPNSPTLPARAECVRGTPRCTIIGNNGTSIQTVEHVLSALKGCEIDNVVVEVDGPEIPIIDGSSIAFVEMIEESGIAFQKATKHVHRLSTPVFWSKGDVQLVAIPSDEFRISYTLNYPSSNFLRSQFYTFSVTEESYKNEIAPCRTFSLYEETVPLIEQGLIKGGSLENAVVIKGDTVLNPEGLRFPDEMVRHKILDLIGDLSLVGYPFLAHIIAIRSGHFSNTAFAKELINHFTMESE
jgi:UDP-3-O-[3-hydroxymyristoyl] N-acetylglucosamine deacetylase